MYLVPNTVFFYEDTEPCTLLNELTSVGIKGAPYVERLHTVLPLEVPASREDWVHLANPMKQVSNKPQVGFEVLSVTGNTAYWRHPEGGVFSTSGVMAAKLLRFGDISRMKLSMVFLDSSVASSLYGLIPEEQLELLGDKGALFDDIYFATQPETLTVGEWYTAEMGDVLYLGQVDKTLVFYKRKPSMLLGEFFLFCLSKGTWRLTSIPGTRLNQALKAQPRYVSSSGAKDVPYLIKCKRSLNEQEHLILQRYLQMFMRDRQEPCTFETCVAQLAQGRSYQENVRSVLSFMSTTGLELYMSLEPKGYYISLKADRKVQLMLDWYFSAGEQLSDDLQALFCKEGWTILNGKTDCKIETTSLNFEGICRAMSHLTLSI